MDYINPRGDVITVFGGTKYRLTLTLRAIMELEELFGMPFQDLGKTMEEGLTVRNMLDILIIFSRAGGEPHLDFETLADAQISIREMSELISKVLRASNCFETVEDGPEGDTPEGN